MLNSIRGRPKRSHVERMTGNFIIFIFVVVILSSLFCGLMYAIHNKNKGDTLDTYMNIEGGGFAKDWLIKFGSWAVLLGTFVPISLLVTLETAKFMQSGLIAMDPGLISENDIECKVNSSSLNEELGQINFVFSDKTGTLTKNEMMFKHLIVGKKDYGAEEGYTGSLPDTENVDFSDPNLFIDLQNSSPDKTRLVDSLKLLALCHTVVKEENGKYSAASPDELALVNFSKLAGCEFLYIDEENNMVLNQFGTEYTYRLLETFEFSSDRKRMSNVIRDPNGKIILLSKGADSVIVGRLKEDAHQVQEVVRKADSKAEIGLRTLLLGKREISEEEWNQFSTRYEVDFIL